MPKPAPRVDYGTALVLMGAKVRAVREKRGISQTDLANEAGIQRKSLQNVERAKPSMKGTAHPHGNPKLDTVFAIAAALEVDVAYLIDPTRPVEPVPD